MGTKLLRNKTFHQGSHKVQSMEVSQYVTEIFLFKVHLWHWMEGEKNLIIHHLADC